MTQAIKNYNDLIVQHNGVEVMENPHVFDFNGDRFSLSELLSKELTITGKRTGVLSTTLSVTVNAGQSRNFNFAIATESSFLTSPAQSFNSLILSDLRLACISGSGGTGTATVEIYVNGLASGLSKAITHTNAWVMGVNDTDTLSVSNDSYIAFALTAATINITSFCVTVKYYYT